jgi:hypothetical protein
MHFIFPRVPTLLDPNASCDASFPAQWNEQLRRELFSVAANAM